MTCTLITPKRLTLTLLLLTSTPSFASCAFQIELGGTEQIMNVNLPKTITLPRNTAIGTTLFESSAYSFGATNFKCPTDVPYGVENNVGSTTIGSDLFPIGNTGLSWQFIRYMPARVAAKALGSTTLSYNSLGWQISTSTAAIRIITTGAIASDTTIPAGDIGSLMADSLKLATFRLVNATQLASSSCETPNINVKMGQHRLEDIPNDGSPSKKAIYFSIRLNNCPAGINNVSYTLTPTSSAPSQNDLQGVINLNQNSTAKGIGLQITDGNLLPIVLNQAMTFNDYSNKGGSFTIPLNARYLQIAKGSSVIPGTANSEITFTMSYQ